MCSHSPLQGRKIGLVEYYAPSAREAIKRARKKYKVLSHMVVRKSKNGKFGLYDFEITRKGSKEVSKDPFKRYQ